MKKRNFLIAFLFGVLFVNNMQAQDEGEARQGRFLISPGVGFVEGTGVILNFDYGIYGSSQQSGAATLGLFGSYIWGDSKSESYGIKGNGLRSTIVALRLTYRYEPIRSLELYAAFRVGLCFQYENIKLPITNYMGLTSEANSINKETTFQGGAYVGIRYRFSKPVGLFVEGGYGLPAMNVGLTFSF